MGREFIGECPGSGEDAKLADLEAELAIKYIKQTSGEPPPGVDVQVTLEGYEVGNEGDEVSYPIISVVWDESIAEYPDEYIEKCVEAFERFDFPEEIHKQSQEFFELLEQIEHLKDEISRRHGPK